MSMYLALEFFFLIFPASSQAGKCHFVDPFTIFFVLFLFFFFFFFFFLGGGWWGGSLRPLARSSLPPLSRYYGFKIDDSELPEIRCCSVSSRMEIKSLFCVS